MTKSFLLAVLAYLVPTFLTGFVWHLVAFHEIYARLAMYRADVIIPFGFIAMLVQGTFFAWVYPRMFSTKAEDWLKSAAWAGLTFAALSWSFTTLSVAAKNQMSSVPDYLTIETAFTLVQFVLVAPLMALAYRDRRRDSASASATASR